MLTRTLGSADRASKQSHSNTTLLSAYIHVGAIFSLAERQKGRARRGQGEQKEKKKGRIMISVWDRLSAGSDCRPINSQMMHIDHTQSRVSDLID